MTYLTEVSLPLSVVSGHIPWTDEEAGVAGGLVAKLVQTGGWSRVQPRPNSVLVLPSLYFHLGVLLDS